MNCENCNHSTDRPDPVSVPLASVEGQSYRRERTLRGTVIVFCVAMLMIFLLVGVFGLFAYRLNIQTLEKIEAINQHWLDYLSEYDFSGEVYEYSQDGRGLNIMGDNNGVEVSGVIADGSETESDGAPANPEGR